MFAAISGQFPNVIASIIESYAEEQTHRTELLKARTIIEAAICADAKRRIDNTSTGHLRLAKTLCMRLCLRVMHRW